MDRIEEIEERLKAWDDEDDYDSMPDMNETGPDDIRFLLSRVKELGKKLDVAREALEFYTDIKPYLNPKHGDIRRKAKAALEKIGGEEDAHNKL